MDFFSCSLFRFSSQMADQFNYLGARGNNGIELVWDWKPRIYFALHRVAGDGLRQYLMAS